MSKKYKLVNSNEDEVCVDFYIFYIVLIFIVIFTVFYINNYNIEGFFNSNTDDNLNQKINELEKQKRELLIANNYYKVDDTSINEIITFVNDDFNNNELPSFHKQKYRIIQNQMDLNKFKDDISRFKNIYKPGEIVIDDSDFNITKNDICYRDNGKLIKTDDDFLAKYPQCMTCSVHEKNIYDTREWQNTKTNIDKVCLFNENNKNLPGVPNLEQCKKFCKVNTENN